MFTGCPGVDGASEGEGEGEGEGKGDARIAITPSFQDFGTTLVGASGNTIEFTVKNSGGEETGGLAFNASGDFIVVASTCTTLDSGDDCSISVKFAPSTVGARSGTLTVTGEPGGTATAGLGGVGAAPGSLIISNTPATFGAVVVGETSGSQTFRVTNTGGSATAELIVALGGDSGHFDITSDDCADASLGAGESCDIQVAFAPVGTGPKNASLAVRGAASEQTQASLSGEGVTAAQLVVAPAQQPFGTVAVGSQSNNTVLTVVNVGGVSTGALLTSLTGADFTQVLNTCVAPLAPRESCSVTLAFKPLSVGEKTGTLTVTSTPGGTVTSNLTGNAVSVGQLSVSPTTISFTGTEVGASSAASSITVTNSGGTTTGLISAGITGPGAANYVIVDGTNTCEGAILPPNGSCSVSVRFRPDAPGASLEASFRVSATPGNTASTSFTGLGLAPVSLSASPTYRDFGTVILTEQSAPQIFTIRNSGGVAAGELIPTVTGDAGQFKIISNGCTALAADSTCAVTVAYAPTLATAAGVNHEATLKLATAAGKSVSIGLSGDSKEVQISVKTLDDKTFRDFDVKYGYALDTDSAITVFEVFNFGDVAANLSLALSGTNAADFTIDTTTALSVGQTRCGALLTSQAKCYVAVRFAPTSSAGAKTASLDATATPGGTVRAALSGTALDKVELAGIYQCEYQDGETTIVPADNCDDGLLTIDGSDEPDLSLPVDMGKYSVDAGLEFKPPTFRFRFNLNVGDAKITDGSTNMVANASQLASPEEFPKAEGVILTLTEPSNQFQLLSEGGLDCSGFDFLNNNIDDNASGPNESCYITAQFVPTGTPGARSSSFVLADEETDVRLTVGLEATAIDSLLGEILDGDDDGLTEDVAELLYGPDGDDADSIPSKEDGPIVAPVGRTGYRSTTFQFTNTSAENDTGRIDVTLSANSAFFIEDNECEGQPVFIGADSACLVVVRFNPRAAGDYSATLTATDGNQTLVYALEGTAVKGAEITLSPESYDFEAIVDTKVSAAKTFTVTNTGGVEVTNLLVNLGSLNPEDSFFRSGGNCSNGDTGLETLAPGKSCTVTIKYGPGYSRDPDGSADSADENDAINVNKDTIEKITLTVSTDEADQAEAALQGTVTPRVTLTPASGTFADTIGPGDDASVEQRFTVRNVGRAPLSIATFDVADDSAFDDRDDSGDFALDYSDCDSTLNAGASCALAVRFSPEFVQGEENTSDLPALRSALLTVTLGDGDVEPAAEAALTGTEIDAPRLVIFQGTDANSDLGGSTTQEDGDLGTTATGTIAKRVFTLKNVGGAPSGRLTKEQAAGILGTRFAVSATTSSCLNETLTAEESEGLAPNASCTFEVVYTAGATVDSASTTLTWSAADVPNVDDSDNTTELNLVAETIANSATTIRAAGTSQAYKVFPAVGPGVTTGAEQSFTISKTSTIAETFQISPDNGNFKITSITGTNCSDTDGSTTNNRVTVSGGTKTCTVKVRFTPTTSGEFSAQLESPAPNGPSAALYGIGLQGATLAIEDDGALWIDAEDGSLLVSESRSDDEVFTITNNGKVATGVLTVTLIGEDDAFILDEADDDCSGEVLSPGESCDINVTFDPDDAGEYDLTIVVANDTDIEEFDYNANAAGADQDVDVTVHPASPTERSGNANFGKVALGDTQTIVYVVSNAGGVSTGVLSITSSNTKFSINNAAAIEDLGGIEEFTSSSGDLRLCDSGTTVLAADGSAEDDEGYRTDACLVFLTYTPTSVVTSESTTFKVNDPSTTTNPDFQVAKSAGSRVALDIAYDDNDTISFADDEFDSDEFDFSNPVTVDIRSDKQVFTVWNFSKQETGILSHSITGDFIVAEDSCTGLTLAGGSDGNDDDEIDVDDSNVDDSNVDHCSITVVFAPRDDNERVGTLTVSAEDTGGSDAVDLTGTGLLAD